jgi:hypothetical protein
MRLLLLASHGTQGAMTQVTMRLEGTHAECLGQGKSLLVVGCSFIALLLEEASLTDPGHTPRFDLILGLLAPCRHGRDRKAGPRHTRGFENGLVCRRKLIDIPLDEQP